MKALRVLAVLVAGGLLFGVVATAQNKGKRVMKVNAADAGADEPMFLPASKSGPMPFPGRPPSGPGIPIPYPGDAGAPAKTIPPTPG
jgi:hypothetical protein